MYIEYASNNSGGDWWLEDNDWRALEKAGWIVQWAWLSPLYNDEGEHVYEANGLPKLALASENNSKFSLNKSVKEGDRWLGALAHKAYKPGCGSLREAANEWEEVTGKSALDAGCPCCGQPHSFMLYSDDGKHLESGPDTDYSCSW